MWKRKITHNAAASCLLLFVDISHLISSLRQSVVFFASFSCLAFFSLCNSYVNRVSFL